MKISKILLKAFGFLVGLLVFSAIGFVGTRIGDALTVQAPTTGALVNIGSVVLGATSAYMAYGAITRKKREDEK